MIKTIYLIRHGETFATKAHSWYGPRVFSAPILEEGKEVTKKIGAYVKGIKTDVNISSTFLRCRQTAAIITEMSGKEFIFDKRVGENLELFWFFRRRVQRFLYDLSFQNHESVLICTHGAVISAITHLYLYNSFKSHDLSIFPNPGVLTILQGSIKEEINFNQ